jgi:DNA-binding XRE family transcriptional regulator
MDISADDTEFSGICNHESGTGFAVLPEFPVPRMMLGMSNMQSTDREEREAVAARIIAAREAAGLRQTDVAAALGIRQQRISSWESGEGLPNTPRLWRTLCDTLGVSADFLMFGRTVGMDGSAKRALLRRRPLHG